MGTRCETIVRQKTYSSPTEYKVEDLFRFYRHWDGYPKGHGLDIANACINAETAYMPTPDEYSYYNCLTNRNWCQKLLVFLFNNGTDMEVEPLDAYEHGDLDYLYVIEGEYAAYGGKNAINHLPVTITVWRAWDSDSYKSIMEDEPLFSGTASEYVTWVNGGVC